MSPSHVSSCLIPARNQAGGNVSTKKPPNLAPVRRQDGRTVLKDCSTQLGGAFARLFKHLLESIIIIPVPKKLNQMTVDQWP